MIRPATPADLPHIYDLILGLAEYERLSHQVDGTLPMLEADFAAGRFWCLVAESDTEIVGFALGAATYSTFRCKPTLWLEDLFVMPEYRGRGIGKALLLAVIEKAKQEGAGRVDWTVLDWNAPSIEFYQRMGATILPDWQICRVVV